MTKFLSQNGLARLIALIKQALSGKQDTLASGTNIKTINSNSLLGQGNISLDAAAIPYDGEGTNYVANGDNLEEAIEELSGAIDDLGEPNEIASISTSESTTSGGNNTVTITETNGTTHTFNVKNGQNGADGVSLGEIALIQTTGDSEESVMSQKAVSEQVQRATTDDMAGVSESIRAKLTALGWEFNKTIIENGTLSASTGVCVTPKIAVNGVAGHILTAKYNIGASASNNVCFYNANGSIVRYIALNANKIKTEAIPSNISGVTEFRMALSMSELADCYLYDNTNGTFLFKWDDYFLNEFGTDILPVSVTYNKLTTAKAFDYSQHTYIKPNYLKGDLVSCNLIQFPKFDLREADGVSVMLNGTMTTTSSRAMYLLIMPTIYNSGSDTYFAIAEDYSNIRAGLMTSYYRTVNNGTTYSRSTAQVPYAHLTITFNFKTGNLVVYNNGVEIGNVTPNTYSEENLRTYLNGCTTLYVGHPAKMSGMAVFPRVLESEEVAELYHIGAESTVDELVPDAWKANLLYPQKYNGSNIGIYTQAGCTRTTDGNKAILTATDSTIYFGFTGISGVRNNLRYEWDMKIVGNSWYPNHYSSYRRVMLYRNNYHDVVHIYNANNEEVTDTTLEPGEYHVVCTPDNILAGINASGNQLVYIFTQGTIGSTIEITNLVVVERGAALVADVNNFKGDFFEQVNEDKIPISEYVTYGSALCEPFYDTYKKKIKKYVSSQKPEYTGQMAVDITNNKVYVGYLTGAGAGTWKQINNS